MTGLADVDGFKICIQVCMWLAFRPLVLKVQSADMKFSLVNILVFCSETCVACGLLTYLAC